MKEFLYRLMAVLLCVGIVGSALYFSQTDTPLQSENSSVESVGDASSGDSFNGVVEIPKEEEVLPLQTPPNQAELLVSGMQMISGASVYMGEDETLDPAIRFVCLLENSLVEELESNATKQAGVLMAPLDYFDAVNPNRYTCIDWVEAFEQAGKTYFLSLFDDYGKYDENTSYVRVNLTNVLYQNINRKFVAVGVVITTTPSGVDYEYGGYCVFYYNEDYQPPRRKRTNRDLSTYQPKSGTRLAYEYAVQKSKKADKVVINMFVST